MVPLVDARAATVPLTVLSPLRPGGALVVRLAFWVGSRAPWLLAPLRQLSFVHFARWSVVTGRRHGGHGVPDQTLSSAYLLFESDFDGDWDDYIDAFGRVLTLRLRAIWGTAVGFPGPVPTPAFRAYVRRSEVPAQVFYSAYPAASTTDVSAALRLQDRFDRLSPLLAEAEPGRRGELLRDFLVSVQRDL